MLLTRVASSGVRPAVLLAAACVFSRMPAASSADLSVVPLFDGTRSEALHAWGGEWGTGGLRGGVLQSQRLPSGRRALVIEFVGGGVAEHRYVQCFASGFGPSPEYYQTRDLTRYQRLLFRLQNGLPTAVRGAVQLVVGAGGLPGGGLGGGPPPAGGGPAGPAAP